MYRVRAVTRHRLGERVSVVHHLAVSGLDHPRLQPGHQPAGRVIEIGPVREISGHPRNSHVSLVSHSQSDGQKHPTRHPNRVITPSTQATLRFGLDIEWL
jgi:hypothetical protein